MEEILIHSEYINLDQLLKWAEIADTGGQAAVMVQEGLVFVNGSTVSERRKKIRPGDILEIKGVGTWKILSSPR